MTRKACPFSPDDLVAFAYGEMDADRGSALAHHLESCSACRRQVEELTQAAKLCEVARTTDIPEPHWTMHFSPPVPFWKKKWRIWAPAALAVCAAIVVFLLIAPPATDITRTQQDKTLQKSTSTSLAFELVKSSGNIFLQDSGSSRTKLDKARTFFTGDTIISDKESSATLGLPDGSRIVVKSGSRVTLKASNESGDEIFLHEGELACMVTPRNNGRSFSVDTSTARIQVMGTKFAVKKGHGVALFVGVTRGKVRVTPLDTRRPPVMVTTRHQLLIDESGKQQLEDMDKSIDEFMEEVDTLENSHVEPSHQTKPAHDHLAPRPDTKKPIKRSVHGQGALAIPGDKPKKLAETPSHKASYGQAKQGTESLDALVARLHNDTGWIFDDMRLAMGEGRCGEVLHKLDGYLSDPDSPRQDEATFLKGVCLERLNYMRKAAKTYRRYLNKWPHGQRAADCRAGIRRIWFSSH